MCATQEPRQVGRLEGKHLASGSKYTFDLGKSRAGAGGNHQFLWLIEADLRKSGYIKCACRLHRPSEPALGACSEDFERRARPDRVLHRPDKLAFASRLEGRLHRSE